MKKIAAYLRLSLSDKDLGENGKDESNSIESQRMLIRNYLTGHSEIVGEVVEYKDDGYTGLNFNRPAFRDMIEDAKKGYIGTIVVKDLSRFGRDYIGVGDYLEQILPSLGVRLIAINNRYDSKEQGASIAGMDYSITNLVNNMYSKDISKKIRSVFAAKWRQGRNVTASVPYGYMIDKDDPTHTPVIDEEAAQVVKRIFALAVDGYSSKEIAEKLNADSVLTPILYKRVKFGIKSGKIVSPPEEVLWSTHSVLNVIKNYDYTGARTHGKIEHIGVGLGKTRRKNRRDWVIVENNHEPIVSKSDYETAQLIIQRRGDPSKFKNANNDLLSGMVRCGCCGHLLQFASTDTRYLYCQHASDVGSKSNCSREQYDANSIRSIILHSLRVHLKLLSDVNLALTERKKELLPNEQESERKMRNRLEELDNDFVRQYENYVNGHLDRTGFLNAKERITEEKDRLESQLIDIGRNRDDKDKLLFEMERTLNIGEASKDCKTLKKTVLLALIEEIRVHNSKRIEIRFRFEDLYRQALEELEKSG